jgi:BolA protein
VVVQQAIEQKLADGLDLAHLAVVNESSNHNVPANSETHFKVSLVSAQFEGLKLIERHRRVNTLLKDELAGPVHALAIHTYTQAEWQKRHGEVPMSPPCLGGE